MRSRSAAGAPHPSVTRAQVLVACARLGELAVCWEPAGALCEEARMALAGEGGLTTAQLERLHLWAHRWCQLDARLRHLYLHHTAQGAVDAALWHLLEQRAGQASGAVYGTLRDLWVRVYGYPPSIELLPRITTQEAS